MNKHLYTIFWIGLMTAACGGPSTEQGASSVPSSTSSSPAISSSSHSTANPSSSRAIPAIAAGSAGNLSSQTAVDIQLTLDLSTAKQTIENFGASDAWSIQYAGLWQSAPDIAEALFSTELDDQNTPKGIGLSLWRFNIGAGSAQQNNILDPWRRSETFLQADGGYDWNQQQGQRRFLQLAKSHGVDQFVAFANSPPIHLTRNGNAFGDGGSSSNLDSANLAKYADFLVEVWQHFADPNGPGIEFDYISPVNEPQWDWAQSNGQEGSPYSNQEIAQLTASLNQAIADNQIQTQIEIPEAAQLNFLYQERDQRGNQIDAFFNPASANHIGQYSHAANKVAGHSYFTTWPLNTLIETRLQLAESMRQYPKTQFWMSEYCVLEDNTEVAGTRDVMGIDPALYTARVIHHDLTLANANAWHWWLAVSPYQYNDGLIYVNKNGDQSYQRSKTFWALGQYSRFIRPGMQRVELLRDDNRSYLEQAETLMASAYHDIDTGRVALVLINYGQQGITVKPAFLTDSHQVQQWIPYVTNATHNMAPFQALSVDANAIIPARSIVTLVADSTQQASANESVIYHVNVGTDTEQSHPASTYNSRSDQAYSTDPASGLSWGYTPTETWALPETGDDWQSLRTDEQDRPGSGLRYRFQLPLTGQYRIVLGFYDPWKNNNRLMDIKINGTTLASEFVSQGQAVLSHHSDNLGNEVEIDILRSANNIEADNDPLLNWIRIIHLP